MSVCDVLHEPVTALDFKRMANELGQEFVFGTGQLDRVVLAMGQLPSPSDADEGDPAPTPLTTLPSLVPYVANPLLRGDEPVLGGCAGLCVITGVAVSATAGDSDELRFLVARRVVPPDGSAHDELVPLTQMWRAP